MSAKRSLKPGSNDRYFLSGVLVVTESQLFDIGACPSDIPGYISSGALIPLDPRCISCIRASGADSDCDSCKMSGSFLLHKKT